MTTPQKVGRYEIQGQVGKGPRGAVFRGMDSETKGAVAIKVVPREAVDPKALAAFTRQAQTLRTLVHPGIARHIEIVETPKNLCFVTAAAMGEPLSNLLQDGKHPDGLTAWNVIRQVLEMLAVAHVHGAVHRDVKPSNVLVAPSGHVTLLDFGTAGLYAAPPANVQHWAPEHFGEGKVGPRSDLYQAGLLAYQLVCGKLPFTGSRDEVRHRVMEERPTDPSSFNNKLAWQLDWVVQKALAKDPMERFASALEFGDGLRLGLQDTVGRPLEPVKITAPNAQLLQNARALAKEPPKEPAKALAQSAATPAPPPPIGPPPPAPPAEPAAVAGKPAEPAAAAPKPATSSAIDPAKPTVLFVDDDPRILTGLKVLFRQDYNALTVESGAAALEVMQRTPVHVLVSDQRMPAMTGVELLRKSREVAPNAVRILLTGYTDLASLVGSINQGEVSRFVKKPWDNEEIKQAIAEAAQEAIAKSAAPELKPPAPSPRSAGSLLVIDPAESLARGLERLLAGNAGVRLATTVQDAAKILQAEEIAAVVADMAAGMDALSALFRELRAKRPQVLSILLTDEPDSEVAIDLINQAHIFRFLPKPVSARDLRTQVAEALRRYAAFKQRSALEGARAQPRPVARPA